MHDAATVAWNAPLLLDVPVPFRQAAASSSKGSPDSALAAVLHRYVAGTSGCAYLDGYGRVLLPRYAADHIYVSHQGPDWVPCVPFAMKWLALCAATLLAGFGAPACKSNAPKEPPAVPLGSPPIEIPAYGVCPPHAVNCDAQRLRALQDSLAAMQKRHRSRDTLRTLPPARQELREWKFYLLGKISHNEQRG